jgi:hypothetical protein
MLVLHILSLGFVLGITAVADKDAFAWLLGKKLVLERKRLYTYHTLIWFGLIALIASGTYLFWPMRNFLLSDLLFDIKLLFVGILVINALLIGRLMNLALTKPFATVSRSDRRALLLSGAISTFSWLCAAAVAMWIF